VNGSLCEQYWVIPAEAQQAVERALDVPNIAAAGSQNIVDHRPVLLGRPLLEFAHASRKIEDRVVRFGSGFTRGLSGQALGGVLTGMFTPSANGAYGVSQLSILATQSQESENPFDLKLSKGCAQKASTSSARTALW
jgi:hypothetical protein